MAICQRSCVATLHRGARMTLIPRAIHRPSSLPAIIVDMASYGPAASRCEARDSSVSVASSGAAREPTQPRTVAKNFVVNQALKPLRGAVHRWRPTLRPTHGPKFFGKFRDFLHCTKNRTIDRRPCAQSLACASPILHPISCIVVEVRAGDHVNGAECWCNDRHSSPE